VHFSPVLFPAFSVASLVIVVLSDKQYIRHADESRYPMTCEAHHCGFRLDSASWPGMTKLAVFFRRINNRDSCDSRDSRDTNSRNTCDLSPPRLGVSLLIASGSMKRPANGQPGGIIPCVSKGISCP
jgi:hypothetical protein